MKVFRSSRVEYRISCYWLHVGQEKLPQVFNLYQGSGSLAMLGLNTGFPVGFSHLLLLAGLPSSYFSS